MSYEIMDNIETDVKMLTQENIALKKEISVLELSKNQLLKEIDRYKTAYEKYANNIVIKFIKRILGKEI